MNNLRTLQQLPEYWRRYENQVAMLCFGENTESRWTYGDLLSKVKRLSAGLSQAGLAHGQRACILAAPSAAWIICALSTICAGAIVVPLDNQLEDGQLQQILSDASPSFIFADSAQMERLKAVSNTASAKLILMGESDEGGQWQIKDLTSSEQSRNLSLNLDLNDFDSDEYDYTYDYNCDSNDYAAMFYTSGTTGPPKGVPLSHRNLCAQLEILASSKFLHDHERILLPLPLHHVYPFVMGMLYSAFCGHTLVLPHEFTGPQLLRALRQSRSTVLIGVPRLYRMLCQGIENKVLASGTASRIAFKFLYKLSKALRSFFGISAGKTLLFMIHKGLAPDLRLLASGGSALSGELACKLESFGWELAIGYGLTETSPLLTIREPGCRSLESVGTAVSGVELKIDPHYSQRSASKVKENGKPGSEEAGAEKTGEVLARGPGVFEKYWNLPDKTKEVFTDDGWFCTGDLGIFENDLLYLKGRVCTLIISEGGEKIQPEEVENVYAESPLIAEIAVMEDEGRLLGLILPDKAQVDDARETDAVRKAVLEAVQERSHALASFKQLVDFFIINEPLPRTRLGKIRRHKIRQLYNDLRQEKHLLDKDKRKKGAPAIEELDERDQRLLAQAVPRKVWRWLCDRYPDELVLPDSSLRLDLGVDSLEWLNLSMEIQERVGIELSEESISSIRTVRDLLLAVRDGAATSSSNLHELFENPEPHLSKKQKKWLKPLSFLQTIIAFMFYLLIWVFVRVYLRLSVKGLDNLPADAPVILSPNHASYLDVFCLATALGFKRLRDTSFAGWTGIAFANPFNRFISRMAQAVPVDRDRAVISSLALAAAVLREGRSLVWFPEGERTKSGSLLAFKPGIGLLLANCDLPVVPVYIHGTFKSMPAGEFFPRPVKVIVEFGKAVDSKTLEEEGEGKKAQDRICSALQEHVAALASS